MHVLIVGGTGLTGAQTALHLRDLGHDVTLMGRNEPKGKLLEGFPFVVGDYLDGDHTDVLAEHEALVFAAGADLRQLPPNADEAQFFEMANSQGVPRFFAQAKQAGVARAINLGTFYPQVAPSAIEASTYVRSRHQADIAIRALADRTFIACSVNAPFIIGYLPEVAVPHLIGLVRYLRGELGLPVTSPAGGVNHISSQSTAEAIASAITSAEPGEQYLIGDENLSWQTYLERFSELAGCPQPIPVSEEEHPLFPDVMLYGGRNSTLHYTPDARLRYSRDGVAAAMQQVVEAISPIVEG